MNKLLSISIAAYNMEKYLAKAIESCISISEIRNKIEVIIVNDGSKDSTLEIAISYQSKYPDCIKVINKCNGGYGSTVNESIKVASGKYFKLLDADDWFDDKELEKFVNCLGDCNSDIVFSDYNTVIEEGIINSRVSYELNTKSLYNISELELKNEDYAMHAVCVKTNLLRDSNLKLCEKCFFTDTEFVFNCFAVGKTLSYINYNVYQYRLGRSGQSVSKQGIIKHANDAVCVAKSLINKCEEDNKILIAITCRSVIFAYQALLLSGCVGYKRLACLDEEIKENNNYIYLEIGKLRFIRLLRKFHYHFMFLWTIKLSFLIK